MNKQNRGLRIWGIYLSPALIATLLVVVSFFGTQYFGGEGKIVGKVVDLTDPAAVEQLEMTNPALAGAAKEEVPQDGSGEYFLWMPAD